MVVVNSNAEVANNVSSSISLGDIVVVSLEFDDSSSDKGGVVVVVGVVVDVVVVVVVVGVERCLLP